MNRLKKMKQSFAVSKKKAQEKVDLVTSSAKEDWIIIMEIRKEAKIYPQIYCEMIVAKLYHHDKDVALRALKLLELCSRNCGIRFREYIAKPTIVQSFYHIMKGNATETVKHALYVLIKQWSSNEFSSEEKMVLIPILHYKLHPLWEAERDDCCNVGKPEINNLCVEHILKSNQKALIFKIFDEVDKLTSSTINHSINQYSQVVGSSTNSSDFSISDNASMAQLKSKLNFFRGDSESSDDENEEDMITEALAKSVKDYQSDQSKYFSSQTAQSKNNLFISELQLNLQFGSQEPKLISLDTDSNETPIKEDLNLIKESSQTSNSVGQQSSSSNPKRSIRKLKSKLECIVCFEFMSSAIFICENGHSVCGDCNRKLTNCPLCKANIRSRNYLLEELAQTLDDLNLTTKNTK